jgi:quercetin dioxygenase-like cupin family protein
MTPALLTCDQIAALESAMHGHPDEIVIEPRHSFAPGLYVREVTLPAGSTAIGHRHRQEHVCIISKGRAIVITEDGREEIEAPCTMIVPAGRKNCVHALEETVWTTVHAAESRDVEELERQLIEKEEPPVCRLSL